MLDNEVTKNISFFRTNETFIDTKTLKRKKQEDWVDKIYKDKDDIPEWLRKSQQDVQEYAEQQEKFNNSKRARQIKKRQEKHEFEKQIRRAMGVLSLKDYVVFFGIIL